MRVKIYAHFETEDQTTQIIEITTLHRQTLSNDVTLGLTLQEEKDISYGIQQAMTSMQVKDFIKEQRTCSECGKKRTIDGYHHLNYRTLFGKLILKSPRLNECICKTSKRISFSPLPLLLTERTSPELSYLEAKWSSLMSYGMTVKLLEEVLPINIGVSSVFNNAHKVANRLEQELGKEQWSFIDCSQYQWEALPKPDLPLAVGIDGGYVHGREGKNRKAGCFEVIVGKSLQEQKESKRFGFVSTYDTKPKRRLYEMLKNQGFQMNQQITFLSDGGDTVRDLQMLMSPHAEHILDWFHVTKNITGMKQIVKGLTNQSLKKDCEEELDSIKWFLWHGNTFKALESIECLENELDLDDYETGKKINFTKKENVKKLSKLIEEFDTYIVNNSKLIPNYGIRYYYGDIISTAFVESTVNEVISKRMVKSQQMRWTKQGAHLLLQLRIKNLNHELRDHFSKWYPSMKECQPNYENTLKEVA